jgi:two-component system response regulator BaeR
MKILIVEDEEKIAKVLVDYFAREGYTSTVLLSGTHAVETIRTERPDFVVLDLMLPGKDGIAICSEVRQFSQVPILMLTAKTEEIDRLLGLEIGADDYVCKPFSPREVVSRIKTIMRRVQPAPRTDTPIHRHGVIAVYVERYVCQVGEQPVDLTPVEFRLLCALIGSPHRVFSRSQLMDAAYDDRRVVSTRTIDSHLKNLRRKLAEKGADDLIRPVYGVGYKLA